MTLKVEAGKFYRTRDGRKVGPMCKTGHPSGTLFERFGDGRAWSNDGSTVHADKRETLVAEWTEEPEADGLEYQPQNAPQVGTLPELDVKPGDVVALISAMPGFDNYVVKHNGREFVGVDGGAESRCGEFHFSAQSSHVFRIVSRAAPPAPHTFATRDEMVAAIQTTTPDYNDGNWHGWNGGERPDSVHPVSLVEYVWHSLGAEKAGIARNETRAVMWHQVLRFRVVTPYTAPREWWIVGGCEAYDSEAEAFDACKPLVGNPTPVHVREVRE